ncbi:MAG TPA: putative porin, partial [Saprospiraceae bacterium]
KGSAFWQPDPKAELAVPELWYALSAYGRIHIFERKVLLMPGVDINYNGSFTGVSYFPVNGVYHLTDGPAIPEAFRIDVALGLQINFIKAFVRMEDFVGLFEDRVLYQADFYPHYRGYFRIGVEAGFFN